jgi:CRISPR-associated protein Csb1
MDMTAPLTHAEINAWADDDLTGPVALHLREALIPVEGEGSVIFPPTYAAGDGKSPYTIDTLSDGSKLATVDSVGSQANRMEPLFKRAAAGRRENPRAALVPQIDITYTPKDADGDNQTKSVSILDAGHRLGDAIVRASDLAARANAAFKHFLDHDDASKIAKISPTSLVFGAWDSRDTQAKLPRIVQSVIRAHDVTELTRSAQYGPPVDYSALGVVSEKDKAAAEGNPKNELAQRGYVHVPSVGAHGGVIARGGIRRDVTLNLVALRKLDGEDGEKLRRYVLGLALVAATAPQDGFLRAGCQLTPDPDAPGAWSLVARSGVRGAVALTHDVAIAYAQSAAKAFGVGPDIAATFDVKEAQKDVSKKKGKKAEEA